MKVAAQRVPQNGATAKKVSAVGLIKDVANQVAAPAIKKGTLTDLSLEQRRAVDQAASKKNPGVFFKFGKNEVMVHQDQVLVGVPTRLKNIGEVHTIWQSAGSIKTRSPSGPEHKSLDQAVAKGAKPTGLNADTEVIVVNGKLFLGSWEEKRGERHLYWSVVS
jgi:hypothetical protein